MRRIVVLLLCAAGCDQPSARGPDGAFPDGGVRDTALADAVRDGPIVSPTSFCYPRRTCWEAPQPQGNVLMGLWGSSDTNVYAVGAKGSALRFDGKSWALLGVPTTATLMALWGSGPDNLYAVSTGGELIHFDGRVWDVRGQPSLGPAYTRGIWGSGPNDIHVVSGGGSIAHYDGSSWKTLQVEDPDGAYVDFSDVWGRSASEVWAISFTAIWRYDGTRWSKVDTAPVKPKGLQGLWGSGPKDLFFSGHHMLHFDGTVWTEQELPKTEGDNAGGGTMWGSGPGDVYAIRMEPDPVTLGPIHRVWRHDGTAWSRLPPPPTKEYLTRLWGASSGRVFVAGEGGALLAYDKARGWTSFVDHGGGRTTSLWGSGPTDVFAGRYGGEILHRTATGWSSTSLPGGGDVEALWGAGPASVYASAGGALWHYDGKAWGKMTGPDVRFTSGLWGRSDSEIYAAVERSQTGTLGPAILRFDGKSWATWKEPGCGVGTLFGVGTSHLFAAGACGVLHYDGTQWLDEDWPIPINVGIVGLWGDSPHNVFAVGLWRVGKQEGLVFHYDGTWTRMEIPAVASLHAIWGRSGKEVYAAGTSGSEGVVLAFDGKTWTRMETQVQQDLLSLWGDGTSHVFVGGMNGAILHRGP